MTLQRLILENVKGFRGRHKIDFSQLNLLYGENSAGKSSVIQSILLLRQSMEGRRSGLEFRGQAVDAGGFSAFVTGHDTSRPIGLGIGFDLPRLAADDMFTSTAIEVNFQFRLDEESGRNFLSAIEYANEDLLLRFSRASHDHYYVVEPHGAEQLVNRFMETRAARRHEPNFTEDDKRWLRRWIREHPADESPWGAAWDLFEHGPGKPGRPFGGSLTSPRNQMLALFLRAWGRSQQRATLFMRANLSRVIHVGPLREIPRRVATEIGAANEVGSRGESLVIHLSRRPRLVDSINDALRRLEVPYALSVQSLTQPDVADALGEVAVAILEDTRTGVTLSTADVGFGLSQVLPVIAQLAGSQNKVILVEQPEIHLHPGVQSRLGDELLRSVIDHKNQVIVETHSEHILTRVQRRMREGDATIDLTAFYLSASARSSVVTPLHVDATGRMLDPWPAGFFDAQAEDLFASL